MTTASLRKAAETASADPRGLEPLRRDVLSQSCKETPYWWDDAPAVDLPPTELPRQVDVAIVGSGYTGLNAALQTVRGGRSTLVFDAKRAGWGCSTRNGGQISTSVKPTVAELRRAHGEDRARAILQEGRTALEWIEDLVKFEGIDCDFQRNGRFHAAHTPDHYDSLARQVEEQRLDGIEAHMVPRGEMARELGSETYHGGAVYPRHAALHPSKFHNGLVTRAIELGVQVLPYCPVTGVERSSAGFEVRTSRGTVLARDVIVATNGYFGTLMPWLSRRVVPIGSYVIATEPLPRDVVDRLFPSDRIVSDTCRVVYYYRASPDRTRVLFGGRVSAGETDPKISGPRLHAEMTRIFPELADTRVSHSWAGTVAYSFDTLAHCGRHDGIYYATAYCGSGVSMASYLGMRTGQRLLGLNEGRTAFDDLPFPSRPLYFGRPWFLPAVVAWYRWQDQREHRRAAGKMARRG